MKKFLAGMLVFGALQSLNQDMIGKEKYLQLMNLCWASPIYTVPLALFCIVLAIILYNSKKPFEL